MNIVFMGTPEFAVPALDALRNSSGFELSAICTRPDAVSKRGSAPTLSPVREAAERLGLGALVCTPSDFYLRDDQGKPKRLDNGTRVLDEGLIACLQQLCPDFIVVAAYGLILPGAVLSIPRYGCINIHASLLPRWRGAAPIARALLAGDEQLGVSIMRMEEGLDTGPFCAVASTPALDKNAVELSRELAHLGAGLLVDALPQIANGTAIWNEQDEAYATYADKLTKEELLLDSAHAMIDNLRRVRASSPSAPARCIIADRSVTVLAACIPEMDKDFSSDKKKLYYPCADGSLEITELKPDGKKAMSARAFLAGIR